jgi:hypothetical protein
MTHHALATIAATMPWAPLPQRFDGIARRDAAPDFPAWHLRDSIYVRYSGDAMWSTVTLSQGDWCIALHRGPGNDQPWAGSAYKRGADVVPIVPGVTPRTAIDAAIGVRNLPAHLEHFAYVLCSLVEFPPVKS